VSIYVEIVIRSSMDEIWDKSQHPKLHQRWDQRFSEIDYLIRERREPQKFLYVTRIGGGCAFRELAKAQASTTMLVDNVVLT